MASMFFVFLGFVFAEMTRSPSSLPLEINAYFAIDLRNTLAEIKIKPS